MAAFAALSGDLSPVHTDDAFARRNGFRGVVVYGGILLAKLSHCLGTHLPGPTGVSLEWTIRFHSPLYVGEAATFRADLTHFSEAMRVAQIPFRVTRHDDRIASGMAQSRLLRD